MRYRCQKGSFRPVKMHLLVEHELTSLWGTGMKMQDRSLAMPFLSSPPALDGTMAGDVGFDPLGFSNYFDLKWLREAELKHGRICMLGCLGFLTQEKVRPPPREARPAFSPISAEPPPPSCTARHAQQHHSIRAPHVGPSCSD